MQWKCNENEQGSVYTVYVYSGVDLITLVLKSPPMFFVYLTITSLVQNILKVLQLLELYQTSQIHHQVEDGLDCNSGFFQIRCCWCVSQL